MTPDPITPVPAGEPRQTPAGAWMRLNGDTLEVRHHGQWEPVTGKALDLYRTVAALLAPCVTRDD